MFCMYILVGLSGSFYLTVPSKFPTVAALMRWDTARKRLSLVEALTLIVGTLKLLDWISLRPRTELLISDTFYSFNSFV